MRNAMACCVFLALFCAAFADTASTWTGLAHDGKFSSAGNWDNPPVSGEPANITFPMDSGLVVENDLADLQVKKMTMLADSVKSLTINGNGYTLLYDVCAITNVNVALTNNVEVRIPASTRMHQMTGGAVFNKKVTLGDGVRLTLTGNVTVGFVFNGTIDGPNAEIWSGSNTKAVFASFINLDKVTSGPWGGFYYEFREGSAGSLVNKLTISGYTSNQGFYVPEAVTEKTLLAWDQTASANNNSRYAIWAKSLTVDRLECPIPKMSDKSIGDKGTVYGGDSTMTTLTLKPTQDSTPNYSRLYGKLSLVLDAKGDYTQSVYDRVNDMSGTITINRGTFHSAGTNSFTSLKKLIVGVNGVFKTDDFNPFSRAAVDVEIMAGGKLDIPTGTKLSVKSLIYDGAPYSASAGLVSAPFLVGGGAVEIADSISDAAYWAQAQDGDWSTAANWMGMGLPNSALSRAIIQCGSANYKVSVNSDVGPISNVVVKSGTDNVAELDVRAKLTLAESFNGAAAKRTLVVGKGGQTTVREGGVLTVLREGANLSSSDVSMELVDGGEVVVDGGLFSLTNYARAILGDAAGLGPTNRISVKRGVFVNNSTTWGNGILLYPNGEIDISGTGELWNIPSYYIAYWRMYGGTIRVREHGKLINGQTLNTNGTLSYGRIGFNEGNVIFCDYALFGSPQKDGVLRMTALDPNATCRMTFSDRAAFTNAFGSFIVGNGEVGRNLSKYGTSVLVLDSDAVHGQGNNPTGADYVRDEVAARLQIGSVRSTGMVVMKRGRFRVGGYGVAIGSSTSGADLVGYESGEGTLRVEGGDFAVNGSYGSGPGWGYHYGYGVIIGDGRTSRVSPEYAHKGLLEITGGTFTNYNGTVLCGALCGEGTIRQSGGEFISNCGSHSATVTPLLSDDYTADTAYSYRRTPTNETMTVGMAGGRGRVELTGGKFDLYAKMCIGGNSTNDYLNSCWYPHSNPPSKSKGWYWDGWDATRHFAKGELDISGTADFTVRHAIWVGLDGTGTVSVAGAACSVKCGGLVLTNGMEAASWASSAAVLRFAVDAAGSVAPIEITKGDVEICEDAKLELDLSAMAKPPRHSMPLIKFAAGNATGRVKGAFAAGNVTVTGGGTWAARVNLLQGETGLAYSVSNGLVLNFR